MFMLWIEAYSTQLATGGNEVQRYRGEVGNPWRGCGMVRSDVNLVAGRAIGYQEPVEGHN